MASRIASLDVIQHHFLMDVDQHVALHGFRDTRPRDLARLKNHVAVGEDHRRSPGAKALEHVEGARIEPIGERVIDQVRRHRHQAHVIGVLGPIALQGAQIVSISELDEERFEDRPVAIARRGAELALQMALEVVLHAIVVQQRVVDVDEEDDPRGAHAVAAIADSARAETLVRSRKDSSADPDGWSAVTRQRQLPPGLPGWFIRASLPRLRTSCSGAIASAATDDHARAINAWATSAAVPGARLAERQRWPRSVSGKSSYHPRVVGLSCVPV